MKQNTGISKTSTYNNYCRLYNIYCAKKCERFEPRSYFLSTLSMIIQVNIVLNRTVVVDSD